MKILSLELSGYIRLSLRKIDYIKITPESKIQLILGTNGSGKSSLLKEMTPLPASHAEYRKGGFKIIEISHRNNHYILKSLFHLTGNKYHFIKNGLDLLGDGGNAKVYKDLVFQEFGITNESHEISSGTTRFSSMEISERRKWITRLSKDDYSYAFKFYNKIKDQLKGATEVVKLLQKRSMQEGDKLLTPEEENRCKDDIRVLSETLSYFLEMKTPVEKTYRETVEDIKAIDARLSEYTEKALKLNISYATSGDKRDTVDDLRDSSVHYRAEAQTHQNLIDIIAKEMAQVDKTIHSLRSSNVQSFGDLDLTIDQQSAEIESFKKQLRYPDMMFDNPTQSLQALKSIYEHLTGILITMIPNKDRTYTVAYHQELANKLSKNQHSLEENEKKIKDLQAKVRELLHHKEHGDTTCPKCSHQWYRGYDSVLHQTLLKQIDQGMAFNEAISKAIKEQSEEIEKVVSFLSCFRQYRQISGATSDLNLLWDHVQTNSIIFDNPRQVVTIMEDVKEDLITQSKIGELKIKQREAIDLKQSLSKNQELNLSNLQEKFRELEEQLYQSNLKLRSNRRKSQEINDRIVTLGRIDALRIALEKSLEQRDKATSSLHDLHRRELLNVCIAETRKELSNREQVLSRVNIQKALVVDIDAQIAIQTEKAKILSLVQKELSPKEGIIAKGLTGFINHFTAMMNIFIKKVWLYPLELVPISPGTDDDVELDYKFEVRVNDDIVISDIKLASSGMKEIIDLAFCIASMECQDLLDSPIYLDEFGKAMDVSHRQSAFHFIANLLTTANFPQIFMISHYEDSYGGLANTDVIVLCDENISLTKGSFYNKNVILG